MKLKDLRFDEKLTELRTINPVIVSKYRQYYRNGASMPLIEIEKGTNIIVSGNHRATAMLKEFGKDHDINVVEKSFKNEAELLKYFALENATHGAPLDTYSKTKLTIAMLSKGVDIKEIAALFSVSVQKVEMWGNNVVSVRHGKKLESHPAKAGFTSNKPLTIDQYEDHKKLDRGIPVSAQAGQLIRWLDGNFVRKDEKNIEMIKKLEQSIVNWLSE